MENLNWLAILLAAILPLIIGAIWYHPKVFGTAWMAATGISKKSIKTLSPFEMYIGAFLISILIAVALSTIIVVGDASSAYQVTTSLEAFKDGILSGFMTGFLIILPVIAVNGIFELQPTNLVLINVFYWIVTLTLMGGLISAWP